MLPLTILGRKEVNIKFQNWSWGDGSEVKNTCSFRKPEDPGTDSRHQSGVSQPSVSSSRESGALRFLGISHACGAHTYTQSMHSQIK